MGVANLYIFNRLIFMENTFEMIGEVFGLMIEVTREELAMLVLAKAKDSIFAYLVLDKCDHVSLTDGNILEFEAQRQVDGLEVREELQVVPDLLLEAELVTNVGAMDQQLAFFSDQRRVDEASSDLGDLVEDQVVLDVTRTGLVDLGHVVEVSSSLDVGQGQLEPCWVDAHPHSPDKHLALVRQGNHGA